jgi:hypothetical protein
MRLLLEMPLDSNRWMLGSSLARGNRHRAPDADPASQCVKAATSCALSRCPAASSHRPKSGIGPAKRKQCTLPRDPIQSRHCVLHNAHRALSSHHTKQYLRLRPPARYSCMHPAPVSMLDTGFHTGSPQVAPIVHMRCCWATCESCREDGFAVAWQCSTLLDADAETERARELLASRSPPKVDSFSR